MNHLVSIIIPIYNSSNYLKMCFQSLRKQTYKNFEVVLVNDGSTDNSLDVCNEICEKDERFIVFTTTNCGVSSARNFGIKQCRGDLLCFIDADDYVEESFLSDLVNGISNADVAFCRFFVEEHDSQIKYLETNLLELCDKPHQIELFIFDGLYDLRENILFRDCIFGSCWRSIFRKKILLENNLSFNPSLSLGEDLIFMMSYLLCCDKCFIVDKYLYHYTIRSNSATGTYTKGFNHDFWNVYYPLFKEEEKIIKTKFDGKYRDVLTNYLTYQFLLRLAVNECILNSHPNIKEIKKRVKSNNLSFKIGPVFNNSNLGLKKKILCIFIKFKLFRLIRLLLNKKST